MNPDTKVLALETGFRRDYSGRVYQDYFASDDLMFPVWGRDDRLSPKDWIWAVEVNGNRKAYPLEVLFRKGITHDEVGGVGILLIADDVSESVRVFESGGHRFTWHGRELVTDTGAVFFVTEEGLVPEDGDVRLERVPSHRGYWFGWHAFYPDAPLYSDPESQTRDRP